MTVPGKGIEPYHFFHSEPDPEPHDLDMAELPDDYSGLVRAIVDDSPDHLGLKQNQSLADIQLALGRGQVVIVQENGFNYAPRRSSRLQRMSRPKRILSSVVGLAVVAGGTTAFMKRESIFGPDLCVGSRIGFESPSMVATVDLCVPETGVHLDSESGEIIVQVDAKFEMRDGVAAPETIGEMVPLINPSESAPAEEAGQPAEYAAYFLEKAHVQQDGAADCEQDLADVRRHVQENADFYAENQLSGISQLTSAQIAGATTLRLVSRQEVSGDGNDMSRDISCS
jgi:hypothetical protein